MYVSISSVIIDDIVLPDGTTHMACLGGGGTHAVMGMRVWSQSVGLVANIGEDFPPEIMRKLENAFDVRGLITLEMMTVRAWQLFEADGRRTEIFRSDLQNVEQLKPRIKDFPKSYNSLEGVHLHAEAAEIPLWVPFLRQLGNPFILWEPWQRDCVPEKREKMIEVLPQVDCISPNLEEARLLMGTEKINDILKKYIEYGAKRAVIREGAEGSTYADADGSFFKVPAVKVDRVVDHTGAGNAYCGGLVVGFVISDDIQDALCMAAVSASFALEQFGAIYPLDDIEKRADERYCKCKRVMQEANL
jgi:cytidine kinase